MRVCPPHTTVLFPLDPEASTVKRTIKVRIQLAGGEREAPMLTAWEQGRRAGAGEKKCPQRPVLPYAGNKARDFPSGCVRIHRYLVLEIDNDR
jgi:hypothetical protein